MTYKEKSALVHILAFSTLLVFIATGSSRWPALDPLAIPMKQLWVAVVAFIIIEIIGQSIIAVLNHQQANQKDDERDKLIEYKASHFSGLVLGFGLIGYICITMLLGIPILSLSLVLSILIIAEIVNYSLQFWYYRRGF